MSDVDRGIKMGSVSALTVVQDRLLRKAAQMRGDGLYDVARVLTHEATLFGELAKTQLAEINGEGK